MSGKNLLLFGCNGQLGFESRQSLPALGHVVTRDYPEVDFSEPETLRAVVRSLSPDVIVNTAAYTAVDKAEGDADRARNINAVAPGVLAEEAERLGAVFVQYSTDYVFDGRKALPYVETDQTNPLSVYGRTKRDGEAASRLCRRHLIFRTSWVVGAHGANFIRTILRLAGEREALRVVADQRGAPTSAALLAEATTKILRQMLTVPAGDSRWGLYHMVAAGEVSWNGLARHVIAGAAQRGLKLKAAPDTVAEISTAEYPAPALRPANSCLDTHKLRSAFDVDLPDWTQGVDTVLDRIVAKWRA